MNNNPPETNTMFKYPPSQSFRSYTLPKRKKSDVLVDNIVNYLANRNVNQNSVFLCKNILNTKYVIWFNEVIFFGEDRLVDLIKSNAYFQTWENITESVIKSALQIISGKDELWIMDGIEKGITPIRVMSLYKGHFIYFFSKNCFSQINFNGMSFIGTFVSKSLDTIHAPENPGFLDKIVSTRNPIVDDSLLYLKDVFFKKLNISEEYFLIVLTWLVQSIASDNYTLLELIGESNSGKTYTQS